MLHQDLLVNQNFQRAPSRLTRSRQLNSDLFALQEQLHRRIASELHDLTCQHLVAASLGLMQIRNALSDPPTIERHCEQLDVSINSALNELRSVAYLLVRQDLFEGGLKAAMEQYAAGFAARTSLVVEVSISPEVDTLPYERAVVDENCSGSADERAPSRPCDQGRHNHSSERRRIQSRNLKTTGKEWKLRTARVALLRRHSAQAFASCRHGYARWVGGSRYFLR